MCQKIFDDFFVSALCAFIEAEIADVDAFVLEEGREGGEKTVDDVERADTAGGDKGAAEQEALVEQCKCWAMGEQRVDYEFLALVACKIDRR